MTITQADYIDKVAWSISEDQLLGTVREMATAMGWLVYHTHDSRRSEAGFPDVVCVGHGRLLIRELKSMKGRIRPAQLAWISALKVAGVDVGVWRPVDLLQGKIHDELKGT